IFSAEDENGAVTDVDSTPDGDPNNDPAGEDDIDSLAYEVFDLALSKTLAPDNKPVYGQNLDFVISVKNEGTLTATNIEVVDYLPCGIEFDAASNPDWTYDSVTRMAMTTIDGPLYFGQTSDVMIVTILELCPTTDSKSFRNVAEISAADDPNGPADDIDSTPDTDPDNDNISEDDHDIYIVEIFDLSLSKQLNITEDFSLDSDVPFEFLINVKNEGLLTAYNVEIIDYLPCGLAIAPASLTAGWVEDASGEGYSYMIDGAIIPNESTTVPITVIIDNTCPVGEIDLKNVAEIIGANDDDGVATDVDSTPDTNPNNDSVDEDDIDDAELEIFDLSLTKTIDPNAVVAYGNNLTYIISVVNEGTVTASNIEVSEYLPCGLEFDAANNPDWTYDESSRIATTVYGGPLDFGTSYQYTFVARLEICNSISSSSYTNQAEISAADAPDGPGNDVDSTPDNDPDNDPDDEDDNDTVLLPIFDLSLSKSVVNPQVNYELEDEVTYSIIVSNEGNIVANNIEITDYIPCGSKLADNNVLPWIVNNDGYASYTYNGSLAPNQSMMFNIKLELEICENDDDGHRNNVAEISAADSPDGPIDDIDSTPDNNPDNDPPNEDDIDNSEIIVLIGADIGDYVFNDVDGDGIQDNNEVGIAGISVVLYSEFGLVKGETTTDATGHYLFTKVFGGDYYIVFGDGEGLYSYTQGNVGNDTNDSDITDNFEAGSTDIFTVIDGEDDFTIDGGLYECATIKGVAYYDLNEDDIRQPLENGINGLKVNLYRLGDSGYEFYEWKYTQQDINTPSDDGAWEFCVRPGTYYIEINLPPIGLVQVRPFIGNINFDSDINGAFGPGTTPSFSLLGGQSKTDLGAGYYPMATVGNSVWYDQNFNGIQDEFEPKVSGMAVSLYDANSELIDQTITNDFGIYKFEYLAKQDYYLKFDPPTGYGFTIAKADVDEDMDSDVTHEMGLYTTAMMAFNPNDEIMTVDAGVVAGVLPLIYKSFEVYDNNGDNRLNWITSYESNVAYFEIERTLDNNKGFEVVSTMEAVGNSTQDTHYQFDDNVINSGRYYYRLKQFDKDGRFSYSKIKSIKRINNTQSLVYPNPTSGIVNFNIEYSKNSIYAVNILDAKGKIVFNRMMDENAKINLEGIPNGVYELLLIKDGELIYNNRIIKLEN
ncbi:MAG: SdrD B-like domain-containing protein, partial [Saprospiraceae bacterium]